MGPVQVDPYVAEIMKDSPQLHWPSHPSCGCLCCEKREDIETEKGSMLDSTKMDEIMSKCLAAGQAEIISPAQVLNH